MRIALYALAFIIGTLPAQSQQSAPKPLPAPTPQPTVQRYMLLTTTINEPGEPEQKVVLLLDTQTGKMWKYHPAPPPVRTTDGKLVTINPWLQPVDAP